MTGPAPQRESPRSSDSHGPSSVADLMAALPEGYSEVLYRDRRWSVTRTVQQAGRVEKLWAEELGGRGVVSANLYRPPSGERLRPCEMPASVVLDFLTGWVPPPRCRDPADPG